ncbi:unnamed protein product [Darwinula stevensoni]|uniref:ETFB lysine methyltransferase n=1 Tax=Darwinula stevensoni TaxID=69355 RepID=A0A7R8X6E1_9CRUS|nr:unnamed protein product [Darwinula stevensoni]CAG0886803.1 unnamed protein product [Darwinula stevensoni]
MASLTAARSKFSVWARGSACGIVHFLSSRTFCSKGAIAGKNIEQAVYQETLLSNPPLLPEIVLNLITPDCRLWWSKVEATNTWFADPFWAFCWPGGQALSRYILDNQKVVKGKNIYDVGSGSGVCGIAACMAGAAHVKAFDIDPVACKIVELNATANKVDMEVTCQNILQETPDKDPPNVILLGDMFYDEALALQMCHWLKCQLENPQPPMVLIGDPGRWAFCHSTHPFNFRCVAKYLLPPTCKEENNGFVHSFVWEQWESILPQEIMTMNVEIHHMTKKASAKVGQCLRQALPSWV